MTIDLQAQLIKRFDGNWTLKIADFQRHFNNIATHFCNIEDTVKDIRLSFKDTNPITKNEYGYFYDEVLPKLAIAYRQMGYPILTDSHAKNQFKIDFGFVNEMESAFI